ncbi:copper chaperone PCu(A)C [Nitratireductor kimnyeongensis]|uniref:Copper chaperone PCu(A)C n=1 Tax=Nitratireductor kimnyeongensis TaxID=430679 RepID=A0ABW0T6W4_9HYPH|nr:copper chaperone PCu(A)C [Nitratireductor kimnyeongensis]QZZ34670.1 copper chaperone PCu(A)C [Nitratireductor kimnyeongensis]
MLSNRFIAAAAALPLLVSSAAAHGTDDHHHSSKVESTERTNGHQSHHAVQVGDLKISHARVRAMLPGQPSGGGYMTIENTGAVDDTLVSLTSTRAGKVEVHTMEMNNDVMVMRPVKDGLTIPAGETVTLEPGGLHVMFMQVERGFQEGEAIPLTLGFEKAGTVDMELMTGPARDKASDGGHNH